MESPDNLLTNKTNTIMKNYKSLYDLNEEQLDCLRQNYLANLDDPDWYSLSHASALVSFAQLEAEYLGYQFSDDDFLI